MKKTYNNILDAFRSVFGNNVDLNTTFDDLNPYKQISTNDDSSREHTNNNIIYILVIYNFRG